MRALGPGSVSSFLKAVLDVIYYALFVAAALIALAAIGSLLAQPFSGGRDAAFGPLTALVRLGPALALVLLLVDLYVAALLVAVERTRRLFATMIAGEPFDDANVGRLRTIGVALGAMEGVAWLARMTARMLVPQLQNVRADVNLTAWFAVLVLFVLAEVFREGARLRAEAALTV